MGKKDVLDILRRFRMALESKKIHVEKMVLFGSWAKGTAGKFSDIDVVVVSRDFGGKDLWSGPSPTPFGLKLVQTKCTSQ